MSAFLGLLNRTITVTGFTVTGEDGGGQPTGTFGTKGTVKGRIDPKVRPDEVDGPDLNPVISAYVAITALPSGFTITERDTMTSDGVSYEVLGTATLDGRLVAHHLEIDLRRVAA